MQRSAQLITTAVVFGFPRRSKRAGKLTNEESSLYMLHLLCFLACPCSLNWGKVRSPAEGLGTSVRLGLGGAS